LLDRRRLTLLLDRENGTGLLDGREQANHSMKMSDWRERDRAAEWKKAQTKDSMELLDGRGHDKAAGRQGAAGWERAG
jgi:hypothetical protein